MYMILVGGGNVGVNLCKRLLNHGHEVLVLEKDSRQAARLADQIGEENVMLGDGCEMITQKDAGFGRADVVVAVTGEDEDNMVICQMAKVVWNCADASRVSSTFCVFIVYEASPVNENCSTPRTDDGRGLKRPDADVRRRSSRLTKPTSGVKPSAT